MISFVNGIFKVESSCATLLLREQAGNIELLYLGAKLESIEGVENVSVINRLDARASVDNYNCYNNIFSFFGDGNDKEQYVLLRSNNETSCQFAYCGYSIKKHLPINCLPSAHGEQDVLELMFSDSVSGALVQIFIATYKNSGAITFSSCVTNNGDKVLTVNRLFSLQLDYDGKTNEITTLSGAWASERAINKTIISDGCFCVESKSGASSNKHNPFVAVYNKTNDFYLGICPIYSGNHKFILEALPQGQTRILSGMNDFMLDYPLNKSESLYAPQVAVYYGKNIDEVTALSHEFVKNNIIPAEYNQLERPILLNNWEATYFDFDYAKIEKICDTAKDLGVELFVLDDGWFGNRFDDRRSLGDWTDNKAKTGGLDNLAKMARAKGLKFGIWVEPEMISPESDLYLAHPEYALKHNNGQPILRRSQLLLNLVDENVQQYIVDSLTKAFNLCNPDYVKWDYNRTISEILAGGKYFYDYTAALYKIIKRIRIKFPNILFESYAAGGNRYDLGMLCFMPQIWASDNTDPRDRVDIQDGTLLAYPQCTMGSHVAASENHQTNNITPLRERFIVACAGLLGYEFDVTKCSDEEKNEIKNQVQFYKEHRKLFQFGKRENLATQENYKAYAIYSGDRAEALVTIIRTKNTTNALYPKFRLGKFDKSKIYDIFAYGFDKHLSVSGEILSSAGLDISYFLKNSNTNSIAATLLYITAKQ